MVLEGIYQQMEYTDKGVKRVNISLHLVIAIK
jgi:hypothetical protein